MKHGRQEARVLFNASVILAGLKSPTGGSAKLLFWVKNKKIVGIVSEIIVDEVMRNYADLAISQFKAHAWLRIFRIVPPPLKKTVNTCESVIVDVGDAHVLASGKEQRVDFLVTLDQKHLLALQKKIRGFSIISPKDLIVRLS